MPNAQQISPLFPIFLSKMKALLPSLVLVLAVFGAGAKSPPDKGQDLNCKVGSKWTKKHIRYECYSQGQIVRGVRPIGCVPDDKNNGKMLRSGQLHRTKHFIYRCLKKGNTMTYSIINCIGPDGKIMKPGEEKTVKTDVAKKQVGGKWTCKRNSDGSVTLKHKQGKSCVYNGAEHKPNDRWIQDGKRLLCRKSGNHFTVWVLGCIGKNGKFIPFGRYGKIGTDYYRCAGKQTKVKDCKLVKIKDHTCTQAGVKHQLGTSWEKGNFKYTCTVHGMTTKISVVGCIYNKVLVPRYNFKRLNGVWVHCTMVKGVWKIHVIKAGVGYSSCQLKNGQIKDLFSNWYSGTVRYRCNYIRGKAVVVQIGCYYMKQRFWQNLIRELKPGYAWKCEYIKGQYKIRQLTSQEYKIWKSNKKSPGRGGKSTEITGNGGSGSGNSRTTPAPPPTTTTTTLPPTTRKTPPPTTTTPKPTTTTTLPPTTIRRTPPPTTTTTTTPKPTTTTTHTITTTPEPTTTIRFHNPSRRTRPPTQPSTTTSPPPTTTATAGKCTDYYPKCESLAAICDVKFKDKDLSSEDHHHMRRVLSRLAHSAGQNGEKKQQTTELIAKIMDALADKQLSHKLRDLESDEDYEEHGGHQHAHYQCSSPCFVPHPVCPMNGMYGMYGMYGMCSAQPRCPCEMHLQPRKPCKHCMLLKRKAIILLKALCPKTCNSSCDGSQDGELVKAVKMFLKVWQVV